MMANYLTQTEMAEIIKTCELLDTVHEFEDLAHEAHVGITLDDEGDGRLFPAYDSNGEKLGDIGMTDGGKFGFYLTVTPED
jgi:hypothetical protein